MTVSQLTTSEGSEKCNASVLQWIAQHKTEIHTPLYLYSELHLNDSLASYRRLFPEHSRGFYSLKANPQLSLVQHFSAMGLNAEIASRGELSLCNLAGIMPSNILVGGVSKSKEFLAYFCNNLPAAIVIESEVEWKRLQEVVPTFCQMPVLLRINPGVSFGGLNMAGGSQFGLSLQQALLIARECLAGTQASFLGLHFYWGSQRLTIHPIVQALETVEQAVGVFQENGIKIETIDLGLGCGVPYLAKDSVLDLIALREHLHNNCRSPIWSSINVWFEAGRALVGRAGYFVARVIERKQLHDEIFVFLDGGLNVHNPGFGLGRFFQSNPRFCFVTSKSLDSNEVISIVGNLCTSADCLGQKVTAPRLEEGDLVVIPNAGAYCMTTALWGFISQNLFYEAMLMRDGTFTMLHPQYKILQF